MSNQIVITSGAKVRELNDVIIGTSGVLSSLAFNVANGVPKLDSNAKILVSQLPNSVMEYQGTWNAATNTPTLTNGGAFNQGDVYLCNVAGTTNFGAGPISFIVGDSAIYSGSIWQRSGGATGSVTSVGLSTDGNAITIGSSPITTSGTITANFAGTSGQYINGAGNLTTFPTLLSSVGLSMPSAFSVSNSPLTANGTIAVTGAGYPSQYIRGDGTLADFPTSGGGGSSVSYYLNGGTSQGTIGGVTYYEMSKIADTGTGVDFPKTGDGLIVSFLTDANDPAQLNIPAGNWNYEIYASMSANGGTPEMYAELYKYDGTTFTLISTSSNEILYDGTNLNLYTFAMTVPATTLTLTDRLAVKLYATNSGGKTTTVHTQDSHLCQIITTFSTGITALNGLTAQVQYFATGTSGTDFAISSSTATHTFNLPVASASNTGKLSSTDWSTFNNKQATISLTTTGSSGAATLVGTTLNIPDYSLALTGYVTLGTTQTITGQKTFSLDILVNNLTIGKGSGTGTLNTAIGQYALFVNTTGYGNTSVGHNALGYNTTGFFNAAIGANALLSNTIGTYNNALGTASLYNNTTGSNNTAVGQQAGTNNTTGSNNTYIGSASGSSITTGSNNTIIGAYAGTFTMANNIVLADGAGNVRYRFDGTNNIFANNVNFSSTIGNGTYTYTLPSASGTLALVGGSGVGTVTSVAALTLGTTGTDLSSTVANSTTTPVITLNVPTASATNRGALSSADWSTFNGKESTLTFSSPLVRTTNTISIPAATTSVNGYLTSTDWTTFNNKLSTATAASTYVPYTGATGAVNLGAYNLTVNGIVVGTASGSGSNNVVVGSGINSNTTGTSNTSLGNSALGSNTTGNFNTGIGQGSMQSNTTGLLNTSIGQGSLLTNISGGYNTAIGATALNLATGSFNTAVGQAAGSIISSGTNNLVLGYQSGISITTGSNNTIVGSYSGTAAMASNVILADGAGNIRFQWDGTNVKLNGNNAITQSGTITTNYLAKFTGSNTIANSLIWDNGTNVGIGNTNTTYKLDVSGSIRTTSNLYLTGSSNQILMGVANTIAADNAMVIYNSSSTGYGGYIAAGSSTTNNLYLTDYTRSNTLLAVRGDGQITTALGTGTVYSTSGILSVVSDMNLKIEDGFIDNALEKVLNLKPRYFLWKKESGLPTDLRQLGFYAQEVNEALGEEAANTPKKNEHFGINDRSIIAMLTKAIQELSAKVESLESIIANK